MPIGWKNVAFLGFCSFLHKIFDVFCSFWWKPRFSFVVDVGAHLHWWYGFRMNVVPRAHLVQWTPSLTSSPNIIEKGHKKYDISFFSLIIGGLALSMTFFALLTQILFFLIPTLKNVYQFTRIKNMIILFLI